MMMKSVDLRRFIGSYLPVEMCVESYPHASMSAPTAQKRVSNRLDPIAWFYYRAAKEELGMPALDRLRMQHLGACKKQKKQLHAAGGTSPL